MINNSIPRRVIASIVMLALSACSRDAAKVEHNGDQAMGNPSTLTFSPAQIQHGKIRWAPVTVTTLARSVSVPGQVVVNEDRTARLGAPATGRVIAVRVSAGDPVARGRVLVTLQSPEAGTAQSDVRKAAAEVESKRAQATYAKSAVDRQQRLLALKATPRQDFERAVADEELAKAALSQAEAELARARSTSNQLGAGSVAGGEIAIRSPINGVVLTRVAIPGTVVEAGAPLIVVTDPSTLWLSVSAPEALSSVFHRGGEISFTVSAFPTEKFSARVNAVGAGLDPDTHTLPVRAVIANQTGRLKPEMIATVLVEEAGTTSAVMLPDDAVQLFDGKSTVFLAQPDSKGNVRITRREVEIGSRSAGRIAVTRGLTNGDVVVVQGAFAVKAQFQKGNMPGMEM